jgi:aminopeptidase YwaD
MIAVFVFFISTVSFSQIKSDRCLVPKDIRNPILDEFSGEMALRHVEILSVDRDRQEKEYLEQFMETEYVSKMAELYGLSNVKVDFFPSGEIWDAEEAGLWLVEPVKKKIASLHIIPEALASGSKSADVETEVIYVGAGRESDFEGKDVEGKIVMGSGNVRGAFTNGVQKRKAVGALGTGSFGVSSKTPGYSLDQIGWQSVRPADTTDGFGFVLSKRQFDEIRGYFDRDQKVVMRAKVKTKMHPYKMNVVSAEIPGSDPEAGELLFVAHMFERIGTPGANDNCSGVANILEIGRTLAKLIKEGVLQQPKRTIRFLWVPEISGSRAFMYKYPELEDKLLVAMNFDMSGADQETTDSWLRMKMTPDSRPSFLNDLIGNLLMYVDQTNITTQWGNNSIFNYRMVPYISSSDHMVFIVAGIPAMQFNYWGDNFYHSSEDRSKYVDPTSLRRTGLVAGAGFYYLANAGSEEAKSLAWESAANGEKWMIEVARQSVRLLNTDAENIHEKYKAAQNKIDGAFNRAKGTVESVLELSKEKEVASLVNTLSKNLEKSRQNNAANLKFMYQNICSELGTKTQDIKLTKEEKKYAKMIPRVLYNYYSDEYKEKSAKVRGLLPKDSPRMPRLASFEVPNFIDGKRSILEIYNSVRAEYGNVTTSSNEHKFAYVITPETSDVQIQSVVDYITAMEKAGLVEINKK